MYILGVNPGSHDGAAALLADGRLICMIEQERLSRRKKALDESPADAIACCLAWADITLDDVAAIAIGWDMPRMHRLYTRFDEASWLDWLLPQEKIPYGCRPPVHYVPHHLAHAASAFWTSGFEEAAIVVIDGYGEAEATTIAAGTAAGIRILKTWDVTQSLGNFYETATRWAGFSAWDAGKFMGLAAYGTAQQALPLCPVPGGYQITGSQLPHRLTSAQLVQQRSLLTGYFQQHCYPFQAGDLSETMAYANFAASVQRALEDAVLQLLAGACEVAGSANLALAGGVAMNCTLNGRIARAGVVQDVYVPPVPFDAGVSLGAALVVDREICGARACPERIRHAYWAPPAPAAARGAAEHRVRELADAELIASVVEHLVEGHIVGWFQGRAEVGQRALGARSILGDPRRRSNLTRINTLKGREIWRPLAPSVLEEYAAELFCPTPPLLSDFMLAACVVRPEVQRTLPAVVHVDGSARPQLVSRATNPRYWQVLNAFREATGVPALINTSFNLAGEPIVYRAEEALATFGRCDLDVLVLENLLIEKCSR